MMIVKSDWMIYKCLLFHSLNFSVCLQFLNNKLWEIKALKIRLRGRILEIQLLWVGSVCGR